MLLGIDTSTALATVALYDDRVLAEITWRAGQDHSRQLLPRIDDLFEASGRPRDDLSAVGVAVGPGSFNGLRVGIATAKAIALGRGLPIVGVDTLRAAAYQFRSTFRPVRPLYDAGRGEVATGLFQASQELFGTVEEPRIATLDEALAASPDNTFFCGELKPEWREQIRARFGGEGLADLAEEPRRAGYLAALAASLVRAGVLDDVATLQPIYLRRPPISGPAGAIGSASR